MKPTSETKFFIGIVAVTILLIVGAMLLLSKPVKPLSRDVLAPTRLSMRGPKDAPHYLVEFSDFQCPACHAFSTEVETLAKANPEKLLVVYRHFPLSQHPNAQSAARVAEAAGAQGKFWEMGALLFDNQEALTEANYASFAATLGLDMTKFTESRNSKEASDVINADTAYAEAIGVNATPTFYLDGVKMELLSPQDLNNQVVKALQK
jgi:protein-disulfide isomerase